MKFLLSFSTLLFLSGCVGPLVAVHRLDADDRIKLIDQVKVYKIAAPLKGHVTNIGPIMATSCMNKIWDPVSSEQDAIAQLQFRSLQTGGNAVLNTTCDSEGTNLAKNCWNSVTCIGTAARVEELGGMTAVQAEPALTRKPVDNKTQFREGILPPKIIFRSSAPKADGTVELSGQVISDASISEVSINGRTLEIPLAKDKSFTVTRGLPMGAVTSYRLSVMDEYGQKAEKEINVERAAIQYAEQVAPLNPRKLKAQANPNAVALIIGIEAYSRLPQAQYADSDATHFYDYASQSLGVPPHKIKLLTDTKANRVDLLQAMRSWMRTEVNGKTDVYIFFAGHGLASADGSKTYLLPADGDRDLLDETSILRDDLIASAKGAKTITLFLDTCYSGGTRTNEVLLADARPIAIVPDKSALPSNVTVLAAASGAQLSSTYEAAQQGLFSYWLMKGLEGDADTNKDKKITTGELHEYVVKQVGPMAQRRNRQQDPQLMGDSTRVLVSY